MPSRATAGATASRSRSLSNSRVCTAMTARPFGEYRAWTCSSHGSVLRQFEQPKVQNSINTSRPERGEREGR
jgi:hypothetical protein